MLNAMCFALQATNQWMMATAIAMGVAVAAPIYCMSPVAIGMYIDRHTRAH